MLVCTIISSAVHVYSLAFTFFFLGGGGGDSISISCIDMLSIIFHCNLHCICSFVDVLFLLEEIKKYYFSVLH